MNISTQFHDLVDVADDEVVRQMVKTPKFYVTPEIVEIMGRKDVQTSIRAMIEAGIAHLPYPELLIEFSVIPEVRRFVLLTENGVGFNLRSIALHRRQSAVVYATHPIVILTAAGLRVEGASDASESAEAILATSMALLMLNTRGVEKEHVEPAKLNRQRLQSGKAPIPAHTVVHIGTVYDRDGKSTGVGGRKMPVHMRAGHTRWQACGEGQLDRKLVFIHPVLVNYHPGDSVRTPERKIVA